MSSAKVTKRKDCLIVITIEGIYPLKSWTHYIDLMVRAHNENRNWFGGGAPFDHMLNEIEVSRHDDTCLYFLDIDGKKRMVAGDLDTAIKEFGNWMIESMEDLDGENEN